MDGGFFKHPRHCWPVIAEVLPKPWTEEMVRADCAYWFGEYERMVKGYHHALPLLRGKHRLSRRWCAKRWGWTEYAVTRALKSYNPEAGLGVQLPESPHPKPNPVRFSPDTERPKHDNRDETILSGEVSQPINATRASLKTDYRPQISDIPPKPPRGGAAPEPESNPEPDRTKQPRAWLLWSKVDMRVVQAVSRALEHEQLSDDEWFKHHEVYAYYEQLRDPEHAEELKRGALEDRDRTPKTLQQVIGWMIDGGWQWSNRQRDRQKEREQVELAYETLRRQS